MTSPATHSTQTSIAPSRTACLAPFLTVLLLLAWLQPLAACRFNVRDVGFVDLDSAAYRPICVVDQESPKNYVSSLKGIAIAAFIDANVQAEVVSVHKNADHPVIHRLGKHPPPPMPWAALMSPDKRVMPIRLPPADSPNRAGLWSALEGIVSTPKRTALQEKIVDNYGVILLVEGTNPAANQRAAEVAAEVLEEITASMKDLPKTIQNPPSIFRIDPSVIEAEKILLWSLGMDPKPTEQPRAAILYGRGRLIGSVLTGDEIQASKLKSVMATIGLSCECGLDRSWMQGTMVPLGWDEAMRTKLVKRLGFDPDNPLIKIEMSQILTKGKTARTTEAKTSQTDLQNTAQPDQTEPPPPPTPAPAPVSPDATNSSTSSSTNAGNVTSTTPTTASATARVVPMAWAVLGLVGVLVLVGGFVILIRHRG